MRQVCFLFLTLIPCESVRNAASSTSFCSFWGGGIWWYSQPFGWKTYQRSQKSLGLSTSLVAKAAHHAPGGARGRERFLLSRWVVRSDWKGRMNLLLKSSQSGSRLAAVVYCLSRSMLEVNGKIGILTSLQFRVSPRMSIIF